MIKGFDAKGFEEFQAVGKEGMDAAIASMAVWTKGWQAIAAECADYSRKSFEQSTQVIEDTINAKSLNKAVEIQAEFAKASYEGFVGEANKIGEMCLNTAREAFESPDRRARDAA